MSLHSTPNLKIHNLKGETVVGKVSAVKNVLLFKKKRKISSEEGNLVPKNLKSKFRSYSANLQR